MGMRSCIDIWSKAVESMLARNSRAHVDRDMYECELALNLHGVSARFSCSGHADMLPAYPYVIVTARNDASLLVPESMVLMRSELLSENARKLHCDLMASVEETGQSLLQLIDAFYRVRCQQGNYGKRLIVQAHGLSEYVLLNQGSIVGLHDNGDYLKEFVSFTTFLKDYL